MFSYVKKTLKKLTLVLSQKLQWIFWRPSQRQRTKLITYLESAWQKLPNNMLSKILIFYHYVPLKSHESPNQSWNFLMPWSQSHFFFYNVLWAGMPSSIYWNGFLEPTQRNIEKPIFVQNSKVMSCLHTAFIFKRLIRF